MTFDQPEKKAEHAQSRHVDQHNAPATDAQETIPSSPAELSASPGGADNPEARPTASSAMRTPHNAQQRIQRILHLQQTYGNAYVRRVLIRSANQGETLYQDYAPGNVNKTTDDFRPNQYGGSARYELTRDTAQNKARVNVRIKFYDQKRLKNAQHSGPKKAIADNDPRRAWATDMCSKLVGSWNGKFELVSKLLNAAAGGTSSAASPTPAPTPAPAPANNTPATGSGGTPTPAAAPTTTPTPAPATPAPSTPGEIHLPIEFVATPVWDISSQAFDQEVALYSGEGDVSTGNPVDSGNWYMKTGQNYGGSLQPAIYAHEYGHLFGLNDEYSRSNHQMHVMFHQLSPTQEVRLNKELDRATIARMVRRGLWNAVTGKVGTIGPAVATALGTQQSALEGRAAAGIKAGWESLAGQLPEILGVDSAPRGGTSFANATLQDTVTKAVDGPAAAHTAVAHELAPTAVQTLLNSLANAAFLAVRQNVKLAYQNALGNNENLEVHIQTAKSVENLVSKTPALQQAANTISSATVGDSNPPTGTGGTPLPALTPSGTLLAQLTAMPGQWTDLAGLSEAQMGGSAMGKLIRSGLDAAVVANLFANRQPGGTATDVGNAGDIQLQLPGIVQNISVSAAESATAAFLTAQLRPKLDTQFEALMTTIEQEVDKQMAGNVTPPAGGTADPLAAAVTTIEEAMRTQLQKDTTKLGANPATEPQQGTAAQDVRNSVQSLMGEGGSVDGRTDYMDGIVQNFNAKLRNTQTEDTFRAQAATPAPTPAPATTP